MEQLATKNSKDIKAIIDTTIKLAMDGEGWAAMAIINRLWPVPRGRLLHFTLPPITSMEHVAAALNGLLQAVAAGALTIPEANELSAMIERQANVLKMSDVEKRLLVIEAKQ